MTPREEHVAELARRINRHRIIRAYAAETLAALGLVSLLVLGAIALGP